MSKSDKNANDPRHLSAQTVAAYLRSHPDFFDQHPDVLAALQIPHIYAGTVSLVERQVALLREQNDKLTKRLDELTAIARENEAVFKKLHRLSLRLMSTTALDAIFTVLHRDLKKDFNVDQVAVRLFAEHTDVEYTGDVFAGKACAKRQLFVSIFDNHLPLGGRLSHEQHAFLFADKMIASAVLIPLQQTGWDGVLAIGSVDANCFYPGIGVDLLRTLGETLSLVIKPWIKIDA